VFAIPTLSFNRWRIGFAWWWLSIQNLEHIAVAFIALLLSCLCC
jgi:hypothetical protein